MISIFKKNNSCDGIYKSADIHFTKLCDNNCAFCIDKKLAGINDTKPNVPAIMEQILNISNDIDDVLFLGGEPCLFLDELLDIIHQIRKKTSLKIYVTTSVPKTCYDYPDKFEEIIELVDGINFSVHHHVPEIADKIRNSKSRYDRNIFYASLKNKNKIRLNINLTKTFLDTKEKILECIKFFDGMGFGSIKLAELQHSEEQYVSFEDVFDIKLGSPYSHGCQQYLNAEVIFPDIKTPILLKRSCFLCEDSLKASISDAFKILYKAVKRTSSHYYVIYGNGLLSNGWR